MTCYCVDVKRWNGGMIAGALITVQWQHQVVG